MDSTHLRYIQQQRSSCSDGESHMLWRKESSTGKCRRNMCLKKQKKCRRESHILWWKESSTEKCRRNMCLKIFMVKFSWLTRWFTIKNGLHKKTFWWDFSCLGFLGWVFDANPETIKAPKEKAGHLTNYCWIKFKIPKLDKAELSMLREAVPMSSANCSFCQANNLDLRLLGNPKFWKYVK